MKKYLLLCLSLVLFGGMTVRSQDVVPNGSFENWVQDLPANWINPFNVGGFQNVFQSADAQQGSSSAELRIVYNEMTASFLPSELISQNFPITTKPASLNGYFKGTSLGNDSLFIVVTVFKNQQPIGVGFYETSADVTSWTGFSAEIIYYVEDTPDEAAISLIVGNSSFGNEGTSYFVDNLYFGEPGGINDTQAVSESILFPNPVKDNLNIRFDLKESDNMEFRIISAQGISIPISGKTAFQAGTNSYHIQTASLAPGFYFLRGIGEKYQLVDKFFVRR